MKLNVYSNVAKNPKGAILRVFLFRFLQGGLILRLVAVVFSV